MPYGFAVVSNAEVSNGAQRGNWHADMSASYRRETKSFSVSLRLADLVPANISDEIFALSQLARVKAQDFSPRQPPSLTPRRARSVCRIIWPNPSSSTKVRCARTTIR